MLKGLEEIDAFRQINDWAKLTETGDRAELTFLSDDSDLWMRLDARRDTCSGQKCPEFNQCFVTAMHQRAKNADLIIVNHHLFFADLALKQDDFGSILPEYSAVVFDEAHEMEDVASDYFGRQISNYRFEELARDVDQTLRLLRLGSAALLRKTQRDPRALSRILRHISAARWPLPVHAPRTRRVRRTAIANPTTRWRPRSKASKPSSPRSRKSPKNSRGSPAAASSFARSFQFLFESNEKNFVYWYERRNKGVFIAATPIDVSQILRERLFETFDTVVLTSATLTVGGRFEYIRQRVGLDHTKERSLPPEFDWAHQALLYTPRTIPDVRNPGFGARRGRRNRQSPRTQPGPRVLPLHQLFANERFVRARSQSRRFSALAARHRAALGAARALQKHSRRRPLRHRELLARRRRSRRSAFLRHRRSLALRRSQRSDRRRSRQRASGRRP